MGRLILILILAVAFAGCGAGHDPPKTGKQVYDSSLTKVCTDDPDLAICP